MTTKLAAISMRLAALHAASNERAQTRRRQPVHVVYGGAHLFAADAARKLGDHALAALDTYASDTATFAAIFGLDPSIADDVHHRVVDKLRREPVEDLRIDFEDGFGVRPADEEDAHAIAVGQQIVVGKEDATLPGRIGIRIKPLSVSSQARALRTLELVTSTIAAHGASALPAGFVVTLPKVERVAEVAALVEAIALLEHDFGFPARSIDVELMVETPAALVDRLGRAPLARLIDAADGRCIGAHFGAYDFTASLGVSAASQRLDHPLCDHARALMQLHLAGTDTQIVDGATTTMPVPIHRGASLDASRNAENRATVHRAWRLHFDAVTRALDGGIWQGWDLHPAQLVSRFAAVHAFYVRGVDAAAARLSAFLQKEARASLVGDTFDDAATGRGLIAFFLRGVACNALGPAEIARAGTTIAELERHPLAR